MRFIRNVLSIADDTILSKELKQYIHLETQKVNVDIITDKYNLSQSIGNKHYSLVFLCLSNLQDVQFVLRLLLMHQKSNQELNIFFTSDNFETFQEIVASYDDKKFTVIPWPININMCGQRIIDCILDKKLSKQVVTKDKKNKLNVDLEFISVFISSTKNVLAEMGQVTDLVHEKPKLLSPSDDPLEEGISSKIMISSEFFKGSFYVIFPKETFLKLYENVVFEECSEIDDENSDFASELANIIYGQSKKVFATSGLNLDMAIPSVHRSTTIENELVIITPFTSSIGKLYIAVAPGDL